MSVPTKFHRGLGTDPAAAGIDLRPGSHAVRRTSLDMPGGSIRSGGGEILLRTQGRPIGGRNSGISSWFLERTARASAWTKSRTVVDGFQEGDTQARFNGMPAAMVRVYQVGNEDVIDISDRVGAYVEDARTRLPDGSN